MHQIKIFKSIESELGDLETEINQWAEQSGAKILQISGNIAPQAGGETSMMNSFSASDVLVIVLYEPQG
jgi:hypothetical protein